MATLRTPLEVALGARLDLDFSDLTYGDLDAADVDHETRETALLDAALETGDLLFRQSIRSAVPGLGGASL